MTTVETGTAQNIEYIQEETRAVAIHEAGHAAASHVYLGKDVDLHPPLDPQARRLAGPPPEPREGGALLHFRSYFMGRLIVVLGAMAAEHVFYSENSAGRVAATCSRPRRLAAIDGGHAGPWAPIR